MKAAKRRRFWLSLIASALFACVPAFASSAAVLQAETRAELSPEDGQNGVEPSALTRETASGYYDPSGGIASGSPVAPNSVVRSLDDLRELGLSANRIRQGTNGRVAIIGRGMDNIKDMQKALRAKGANVEVFDSQITESMLSQFDRLKKAGASAADLKKTDLFQANRKWAQKLADEGYTVIDAGDPLGMFAKDGWSVFYALEKSILFP